MSQENGDEQDSKAVPMIISFFFWGGGQLYEGRTKAGIAWLVTYVVSWIVTILTGFLFAPIALIIWIVNLYDTYAVLLDIDE